jgi:hypothetical protein
LQGVGASYPPQPNLAFAWDAVYGQGFFVAKILGKKFGQGVFIGNQGTLLQVETLDGRNGKNRNTAKNNCLNKANLPI